MRYLIIGNGAAGTNAAKAIRENDPEGEIIILTDEKTPYYSRPRSPEYLRQKASTQDIMIFKPAWYHENRIDLHLGEKVQQIIPAQKTVRSYADKCYEYDKLLIAIGSVPYRIPVPGVDGEHVLTLRTIDDAFKIRELAKVNGEIAVIGGGLLGLEAANALAHVSNSVVTVIEFFNRLLPRQLDEEGAGILRNQLVLNRLRFELNAVISSITDVYGKQVIEIADGRKVQADFIVVSTGIKISDTLVKGIGIAFNKGILVDDTMQTNIPDIYAAGDCAEHKGRIYGIWPAASEQGRVAGRQMAGVKSIYKGTTVSVLLKVAGIDLASIGEIPMQSDPTIMEYKKVDSLLGIYKKLFVKNDILRGAILMGDVTQKNMIQKAIGLPYKEGDWI